MQEERDIQQLASDETSESPHDGGQRPAQRPGRRRSTGSESAGSTEQVMAETPPTYSDADATSTAASAPPASMVRAEQLLDEALVWGAAFGTVFARRARRLIARAREEVEDLWAEAEAIRNQWQKQLRHRRTHPGQ